MIIKKITIKSHTFANDTTMGMYRPGTNTLALATGGAARIEMNNTSINYIKIILHFYFL